MKSVKEELVMSIVIHGHGGENYLIPSSLSEKQLEYSKNNVRGFNLGCVPGFDTWESIQEEIDLPFLYKMFDENRDRNLLNTESHCIKIFLKPLKKKKISNRLKKV
jgi:hypothetical protein